MGSGDEEVFLGQITGFDGAYAAEQLRRSRHPVRRLIRGLFLRNQLRYLSGPTIDFGCGAGQLLARLPPHSVGVEANPDLVARVAAQGHSVHLSRGDYSDFDLLGMPAGRFRSLVIAHVLEHLDDPARALWALLRGCRRLGVTRVLMVVPGARCMPADATHRTLIDRAWLAAHPVPPELGFAVTGVSFFPGPGWLGSWFAFHEMLVVFDCAPARGGELTGKPPR